MDEALKKEVDAAIAGAVEAALKPILSQVGQVGEAGKKIAEIEKNLKIVGDTVAGQKMITLDDVKKAIGDDATARETKAVEAAKSAEAAAAFKKEKDSFIAEKLKGIPSAYHNLLGDAKEKWAEAEKTIRDTFAADAKAAGLQVPNLGGSGGGAAPASAGAATDGFLVMPGAVK